MLVFSSSGDSQVPGLSLFYPVLPTIVENQAAQGLGGHGDGCDCALGPIGTNPVVQRRDAAWRLHVNVRGSGPTPEQLRKDQCASHEKATLSPQALYDLRASWEAH